MCGGVRLAGSRRSHGNAIERVADRNPIVECVGDRFRIAEPEPGASHPDPDADPVTDERA